MAKGKKERAVEIVEQLADGILILNDEGKIHFANPAACRLFGRSREELLGFDFGSPTLGGEMSEVDIHRKSGGVATAELRVNPVEWDGQDMRLVSLRDVTERKRMEQEMTDQKDLLTAIYRNAPLVMMVVDAQGRIQQINGFARQFANRDAEEMLGLRGGEAFRCIHALDDPQGCGFGEFCQQCIIRNTVLDTLENGKTHVQIETPFYFKGQDDAARELMFLMSTTPIEIKGEGVVLVTLQDITARKQAERALEESEEKYRRIAENVTDVVWITDLEMNPSYISPSVERVLGIKPEEYLQRPIAQTYPPASLEIFRKTLAEELAKERDPEIDRNRIFHLEVERYSSDGTIGWDAIRATFLRDEHMNPIAIQGVSRDITERVKAEEALRESEARFKALHNASFGGIAIHDKGVILECNQGLSELTGFSYAELIGMDGLLLIAENSRDTVNNNIRAGHERPYEVVGVRKNGEEYPVRLEARSIPYKGKKARVVEFRDITEQKQAEAEKEKLQSQLLQAQKMESVGQLAGGVAHDFNNMLGVILGHTEMALEQIEPGRPLFEDLQEISKAAERSVKLTRQLLTFARKQIIAPRIIDLNETVEGMLKMLRRLIGEDIDLAWLPGKKSTPIQADASQIDQMVANLCINARDAINDVGKITIETDVVSFDEAYCAVHAGFVPGEYVLLAISDNGCGMDPETRRHLFEPFFTTKERGRGTGLGLASVYGAVKQNNGFINVYSEPDRGTTFKIYLPCHRAGTSLQDDKPKAKPTARGGETILLVEDEPSILRMATIMLESLGYVVIAAKDPEEAIRLAHEHRDPIDLLMTDVVMPEMNGRDLAAKLLSAYPGIKVLFMSGYTANVIAHQGVLDEGVYFIQKPFSSQELGITLRKILRGEKAV